MSHETNLALVQHIYQALADRDVQAVMAAFAPNMVLHEPTTLPYGGTYTGIEEITGAMTAITEHLDLFNCSLDRLVADDDMVVALVSGKWNNDRDARFCECWTLSSGQAIELSVFAWSAP